MDLHLSQACRRYATQSSTSFFDRQLSDVHIANDESMKSSGANRSAKVVKMIHSLSCENFSITAVSKVVQFLD
jgi:hypothetical protein